MTKNQLIKCLEMSPADKGSDNPNWLYTSVIINQYNDGEISYDNMTKRLDQLNAKPVEVYLTRAPEHMHPSVKNHFILWVRWEPK